MPHATPLIAMIVGGIVLAFLLAALAVRLRLPPLLGYLLAGVAIGPFTPGFVADQDLANELAELGVILLMFGVGMHFSVRDLLAVRRIAVPGAIAQIAFATLLGAGLAAMLGWGIGAGLLFGLALSVASTVVLLRALQDHRLLDSERGRIAVGWLIVEDLVMVLVLVLVPALAQAGAAGGGGGVVAATLGITIGKVALFVALMLVVGRRLVPWLLHAVAHSGSRELFRLAVLATALGVAFGSAQLFGVSFALGAFFAGMVLAESELSHRAAEETLPLRDAFAVLFFVSVGMLFNPAVLVEAPLALLATVAVIVLGKSLAAFAIVRLTGGTNRTALVVAASLAQIGEFSFILAALGGELGLIPDRARDLILAGAIVSIVLNPFLFTLVMRGARRGEEAPAQDRPRDPSEVVIVGAGRVGALVAQALVAQGRPPTVIEMDKDALAAADRAGARTFAGNAAAPGLLGEAGAAEARLLLVAIPTSFEAGQIVEQARALNPAGRIVARAHSDEDIAYLTRCGADATIMGEREIARRMIEEVAKAGEG